MDPDALARDLAEYYDREAMARALRPIQPERIERRRAFIERLLHEGRSHLVEVGTGPGIDALPFIEARMSVAGVDLSDEHVRLARTVGVDAYRASVLALPFADASFDAGWTMSTLLHVPNEHCDDALREIGRVLADGAPLAVGLWGSGTEHNVEALMEADTIEPKRFFSRRSDANLRAMLSILGDIESFETWNTGEGTWTYQFAIVRRRAR